MMGRPERTPRRRLRPDGFTLMEVMAAVAILGTAMFVLLDAHYTAMRLNEILTEEVNLRQLAETVIAKAEVEVLAGQLTDAGDFGPRYEGYSWSYEALLVGNDPLIPLYGVSASIRGPAEERNYKFMVFSISPENERGGAGTENTRRSSGRTDRSTPSTRGSMQPGTSSSRRTMQPGTSSSSRRTGLTQPTGRGTTGRSRFFE